MPNVYVVLGAAKPPHDAKLTDGDAGIDAQPVELGPDAEQILRDRDEAPGRRAGEPRVLGLAVARRLLAGDHLRVDVGLGAVDFAALLEIRRRDLAPAIEGAVGTAQDRLG